MRDMTLNFKRDLSVSNGGKLCIWKEIKENALYDCTNNVFYSKGVNVKIAMALSSKYYAKDRKFRDFCLLIRSMIKET